eukprot:gene6400-2354_t
MARCHSSKKYASDLANRSMQGGRYGVEAADPSPLSYH